MHDVGNQIERTRKRKRRPRKERKTQRVVAVIAFCARAVNTVPSVERLIVNKIDRNFCAAFQIRRVNVSMNFIAAHIDCKTCLEQRKRISVDVVIPRNENTRVMLFCCKTFRQRRNCVCKSACFCEGYGFRRYHKNFHCECTAL